jgi:RecB family exonuclease
MTRSQQDGAGPRSRGADPGDLALHTLSHANPFLLGLAELCRKWPARAKRVFVPSHALGRTLGERLALSGTNWLNLRFVTPLDIALRMGAPFLVERGIEPSEEGLGPALAMRLMLELPLPRAISGIGDERGSCRRTAPPVLGAKGTCHEEGACAAGGAAPSGATRFDPPTKASSARIGYFRPLADQPTMGEALWSTLRELRMCGVSSRDLERVQQACGAGLQAGHHANAGCDPLSVRLQADRDPSGSNDAFENPAKHAEIVALLSAYERYLTENNRADMADVYVEALRHPDWCPIQPADCWTELPDVVWTPLQRRLIDAMPGERVQPLAVLLTSLSMPRRLQESPVARVQVDPASHPLAFLMNPLAAEPRVHVFHAGGREAEIEEVFRRILASGTSLDQVEIACASDAHVALVWEKALRHEWPVTLGPGIAAAATRPGRALLGFCDWIETDCSAANLRRLLQSGDMGVEEDDEGFTAGQAARTIARAEAGWGRATYGLALGVLRKEYEARGDDLDLSAEERDDAKQKAERTGKIEAWITSLIAAIPHPADDGLVSLQAIVETALSFIERSTARSSALDHRAAAALADHVADLRALGVFRCTLTEALRFLRERVLSLAVAQERPRPGHLHASALSQACHAGRPHLFVVGLEEGRMFPVATEDPVLLDAERAAISPALRRSTDKIDEAVHGILSRLAAWEPGPAGGATFSYSTRDTREFRETYASWLMLQAFRLQRGSARPSFPEMKAALGEPVSSVPEVRERASSAAGWWLRSVVSTGEPGTEVVEDAFSSVAAGRRASEARQSERFTEYDGHVPNAAEVLDPCANGRSFAVTDLESAAGCPYRFFLKRGLGLRPLDGRERDRDIWLDPLTRGAELHEIYAALLRRCRDAGRRPDQKKDGAWLRDLAATRLQELHEEMPAATAEILERESRDFFADVDLFLEAESEPSSSEPVGLEVSFGRPLNGEAEPLARAEPVEIDLGRGLRFRVAGRIDRIDRIGPTEFEILDYKTGGFWRDNWAGTFNGGRRLQHALYGLAAVELLRHKYKRPRVTRGVYSFCTHKGHRERVEIPAPTSAETASVLADLRDLILSGAFVHAPDEDDCKWCDYAAACGRGVNEQAAKKIDDGTLDAYRRLAAHE